MPKGKAKSVNIPQATKPTRRKISQADIPAYSLSKALRVARALYENYGKDPAKPLRVAEAMNMSPTSGPFRALTGASIAYGLTEGGYNAPQIGLTPLGRRICAPTMEGDDLKAKREATLKPKIVSEFLSKYNDSPLPSTSIACNVLEEMGVPRERTKEVHDLIVESAKDMGFLREIKGKTYVDLQGTTPPVVEAPDSEASTDTTEIPTNGSEEEDLDKKGGGAQGSALPSANAQRVFITHGKNHSFLDPIRKLLTFGGFEPVTAAEKQTVSQPVPEKVMEAMRSCGAAIIHIDAELKLTDGSAKEHTVLNPNVLIEIGAAMALYGKRFILLVRDGVELPSNLQGLYQVRYTGDVLDSDATIKLLEAINDIKNHSLPIR